MYYFTAVCIYDETKEISVCRFVNRLSEIWDICAYTSLYNPKQPHLFPLFHFMKKNEIWHTCRILVRDNVYLFSLKFNQLFLLHGWIYDHFFTLSYLMIFWVEFTLGNLHRNNPLLCRSAYHFLYYVFRRKLMSNGQESCWKWLRNWLEFR